MPERWTYEPVSVVVLNGDPVAKFESNKAASFNYNKGEARMGIMIIPGGCRQVDDNGQLVRQSCETCVRPGFCEFEPRAREMAEEVSQQWVSTCEEPPPAMEDLLYLECSSLVPSGVVVHHGYYDENNKTYVAWTTNHALPADSVIAWMLIPAVPEKIFQTRSKGNLRNSGRTTTRLNSVEG
ncbi:MAG: hypothetical protein V2J55_22205 [Candidatus Competibacteraceae bacterium]|jgi:hypothetical protein|nr:hypothetical protein [Candidatus Competibacteraceae bacterium]